MSKIVLYRMLAFSVVQFPMQLRCLPKNYKGVERYGIYLSMGGPFNAYPLDFLFGMKNNNCFPISFPCTLVESLSVKARVMQNSVPSWHSYYEEVIQAMTSDDAYFFPQYPDWFQSSAVNALYLANETLRAHNLFNKQGKVDSSIFDGTRCESEIKLQRLMSNSLCNRLMCFDLRRYLIRKNSRWFVQTDARKHADSAISVLARLKGNVPPCVLNAIFSTWCNAWNTDRRFQNDLRDCVLCSNCKGKDEIEHYLRCPYGFAPLCRKLNINPNPCQLNRVMLVTRTKQDDPILMSVILYSIRGTVHKLRDKHYRAKPSEITAFMWEQVRVAAAHHAGLRKRIHSIWNV